MGHKCTTPGTMPEEMEVIFELPEQSADDERMKQEVRDILTSILREHIRDSS